MAGSDDLAGDVRGGLGLQLSERTAVEGLVELGIDSGN
jgi:hypothetical protein